MGKLINKENIALIFGVSGQDGGYLAEFLINKGYKVFGTTRSINNEFYQLRQMDIFNKVFLHEVDTSNFDSVYNLISKILPRIAPKQIISASPPKVLPTPFSIETNNAAGCIPSNKPVRMATINNDKKGLTFFIVRNTCNAMAKIIIGIVISLV